MATAVIDTAPPLVTVQPTLPVPVANVTAPESSTGFVTVPETLNASPYTWSGIELKVIVGVTPLTTSDEVSVPWLPAPLTQLLLLPYS